MEIISHRGFWSVESEKNTFESFKKSLDAGFGIEVDVRAFQGELVVSHDLPSSRSLKLNSLLKYYKSHIDSYIAFNVKEDGLSDKLFSLIKSYEIKKYFFFDMSIPDTIHFIRKNLNVFCRNSEYELGSLLEEKSQGFWVDEFFSEWVSSEYIEEITKLNKPICFVSPELHNRDYKSRWIFYKEMYRKYPQNSFYLCTDYPDKARNFFYEKN